ncbi:MAG: AAA family ATPase [Proteobacteria bacterium]|nr:AAA family ATPase [Pseudomonadota bacterium]
MFSISGYEIGSQLHEGRFTSVYRGYDLEREREVIVKVMNESARTWEREAAFRREHEIMKSLKSEGVPRVNDLVFHEKDIVMIWEDIGGDSLAELILSRKIGVELFLRLAIKLAKCLNEIHQQDVVFLNINPSNIIWNPETERLVLTDFKTATRHSFEAGSFTHIAHLEKAVPYLSPELTGRTNRIVDFRSDYYSLGATLYQLLTGSLPFKENDVSSMMHAHLTRTPPHPGELDPGIPVPLGDIVLKLLDKDPDNRYQSAAGLNADLQRCLDQLSDSGRIETFVPGEKDVPSHFRIPQSLFARENEIRILLNAIENMTFGEAELVLVSGAPGVGKTTLVNELQQPIIKRNGYFIKGKFDEHYEHVPFSAIRQALQSFNEHLMTENEERLISWKSHIGSALGPNLNCLVDLVPEMKHFMADQTEVATLDREEFPYRVSNALHSFFRVVAQFGGPMVLFLDDGQWIDRASLRLIDAMLTDTIDNFLIVIAYRDREADKDHPLSAKIREFETKRTVHKLHLKALSETTVNRMLSETLYSEPARTQSLSKLIFQKTQGNPFYVIRLLNDLHEKRHFRFSDNRLEWDLDAIRRIEIDQDVVGFLAAGFKEFPRLTRKALRLASCLGTVFELRILSIVLESDLDSTTEYLMPAVQGGYVHPVDNPLKHPISRNADDLSERADIRYRFQHDRLRQTSFSTISLLEESTIFQKIGRLLLKNLNRREREERATMLVKFIGSGLSHLRHGGIATNWDYAEITLAAGREIKSSADYGNALHYLTLAWELLPPNAWSERHDMCFTIARELAECHYLYADSGHPNDEGIEKAYRRGNEYCGIAIQHSESDLEKAEIYRLQADRFMTMGRLSESMEAGKAGLSLMGNKLSENPSRVGLYLSLLKVLIVNLGNKKPDDYANHPRVTDSRKIVTMKLLNDIRDPASTLLKKNMAWSLSIQHMAMTLQHGLFRESPASFMQLGRNLVTWGRKDKGFGFMKFALKLVDDSDDPWVTSKFITEFCHWHIWWLIPWKELIPRLDRALEAGLATGNLLNTRLALHLGVFYQAEYDLDKALNKAEGSLPIDKKGVFLSLIFQRQRCLTFSKPSDNPLAFYGEVEKGIEKFESTGETEYYLLHARNTFLVHRLEIAYYFEDYTSALAVIRQLDRIDIKRIQKNIAVSQVFCTVMTLAACYSDLSRKEKRWARKVFKPYLKMMEFVVEACPENFLHLKLLMDAEIARAVDKNRAIEERYLKAAEVASHNGTIRYQALAYELAAKSFMHRGFGDIAVLYMAKAVAVYRTWGGEAKALNLQKRHPEFFKPVLMETNDPLIPSVHPESTDSSLDIVDTKAIITMSRAMAEKTDLGELLRKGLSLVIENAGAQKGVLLMERERRWFIEAEAVSGTEKTEAPESAPLELGNEKPENESCCPDIVRYVVRTRQPVVLDDAAREERFVHSRYIRAKKPKSVLCLPLLNQDRLTGIVYLENNFNTGVFSRRHLAFLEALSAQFAISLQNALLYQDLLDASIKLERQNRRLAEQSKMKDQFLIWATNPESVKAALGHIVSLLPEIRYVESDRNYCLVVTKDRTRHLQINLKEVASHFPAHLVRIHRRFLVNPKRVRTLKKVRQQYKVTVDEHSLPVGSKYLESTRERFK